MTASMTRDHMHLRRLRDSVSPKVTLDDVALELGRDPDKVRAAFSRWERGLGGLPGELTPSEYEHAIRACIQRRSG